MTDRLVVSPANTVTHDVRLASVSPMPRASCRGIGSFIPDAPVTVFPQPTISVDVSPRPSLRAKLSSSRVREPSGPSHSTLRHPPPDIPPAGSQFPLLPASTSTRPDAFSGPAFHHANGPGENLPGGPVKNRSNRPDRPNRFARFFRLFRFPRSLAEPGREISAGSSETAFAAPTGRGWTSCGKNVTWTRPGSPARTASPSRTPTNCVTH